MASRLLRVLFVEDSADDAELMLRHLRKAGFAPFAQRVETRQAMQAALASQAWDIVISDHSMPGFSSFDALSVLGESGLDLPFILVSGAIGEEQAVQMMKAGAHDFLFKNNLSRLGAAIERELNEAEGRKARRRAEQSLQANVTRLKQAFEGIIQAMAVATEMRDPYTAGHQHKVAQLALVIAREMGFPEDAAEGLRMAGMIHDLGKIAVPAELLSKPGILTPTEFSLVKVHPRAGYDILKSIAFPWPVADMVYQHHERLDGAGYPRGLLEQDILMEARILGVADVVEAMSSHRPYRPALGRDKALEEISRNRGILYDRKVVDACVKAFPLVEFQNTEPR